MISRVTCRDPIPVSMVAGILVSYTHKCTYWSIIDERNLHHGLKHAVLDPTRAGGVARHHLAEEVLVQPPGLGPALGAVKVWLVAFLGRGEEREL